VNFLFFIFVRTENFRLVFVIMLMYILLQTQNSTGQRMNGETGFE
jgi:hypothetical protein